MNKRNMVWYQSVVLGIIGSLSIGSLLAIAASNIKRSQDFYNQGMAAGNAGNLQKALTLFERAIKADPKNFMAYFDQGGAYEALGQKEKTIPLYEKTVLLKPDFSEGHNQLATLYLLNQNKPKKAIVEYKKALLIKHPYVDDRFELVHTRSQSLRNLAVAYAQLHKLGIAIGIAQSFIKELDSHSSTVSNEDSVASALNTLITRATEDQLPLMQRPCAKDLVPIAKQIAEKQLEEGKIAYEAFLKTDNKDCTALDRWDAWEGLGLVTASLGNMPQAEIAFAHAKEQALSLSYRKIQESDFNLACALSEQGKIDAVWPLLEEVLWIDFLTQYDSDQGKMPYLSKIRSDSSLKKLQGTKPLMELLFIYDGKDS